MMKKILILWLSVLTMAAYAQTSSKFKSLPLANGSPESVGMSSERLARIDSFCLNAVSEGKVPGIVALVARNGKIVYHKAFGMDDKASDKPMKKDDIFRIASQTKAITSTAVMMLWEEGKFGLDDPISKYIPEFKNPQVLKTFEPKDTTYTTEPAKSEITIRQLLCHTSGLGYGFIDSDPRIKAIYAKAGIIEAWTTERVLISDNIKKLAKLPLRANPGEAYNYCMGLDVLGYFIEVVSGMPFDVFLKKRLFEPLGMTDTWFYLPKEKVSRLVTVQTLIDGKWSKLTGSGSFDPDYPVKGAKTIFSGGGGLSSTAKDYATFLQMYLNAGELNGKRFLSRTTIQTIMANNIGNLWGENPDLFYGLAFAVVTQKGHEKGGLGSAGSFGWGGAFNTQYFADPKEKVIGIIMKQTYGQVADDTDWKFRILVSQAIDD
ncbi:MAG: serine hydrolase domain-containing protein [Bacteroidales bacterium]